MGLQTAASALSLAGTAAGAIGNARQGRAQAAEQDRQAQFARIRANEVEAVRRQELSRALSTFRAARGANNQNLTSPTARVLERDFRRFANADRIAEVGNIRREGEALARSAQSTRSRARVGLFGDLASATPDLFSLLQR